MSEQTTKMKKNAHSGAVRIGIIIAAYVVFYALSGTIFAIGDKSAIAGLIIVAISCWFGCRFFKGTLFSEARSLWGYAILFVVGAVTGIFVAPYYIGDKIAKKVLNSSLHKALNDVIEDSDKKKNDAVKKSNNTANNVKTPTVKKPTTRTEPINIRSEQTEELDKIHTILLDYVYAIPLPCALPGIDSKPGEYSPEKTAAFKRKKLPCGRIFGCDTYGDAEMLNREIVAELDRREAAKK